MPINIPGLLVPFQLILYPRLVVPHIVIKDIRQLDFVALKNAGYRGAVFDKDNCLTLPHKDTIVPGIQQAWSECRKTFGDGNILIVSNSAGTWSDPGGLQCESVTHHTGVPVLRHKKLKPSHSCIAAIRDYFSSLRFPIRDEELIVVGDRIFTDVVMANRIRMNKQHRGLLKSALISGYEEGGADGREKDNLKNRPRGPLAVWTTGVWEREAMTMRWCEKKIFHVVDRWTQGRGSDSNINTREYVREPTRPESPKVKGIIAGFFGGLRRG